MSDDDAAALIKRLVDASDASSGDYSEECKSVIKDMKEFLSKGWNCGRGCEFSGSYDACAVHEDEALCCQVRYVSIGSEEQLELEGNEIDLSSSSYTIGDDGCLALCKSLANDNVALSMLDLEANGLSSIGGSAVAEILQGGTARGLTHLNIGCNSICGHGAAMLAAALRSCPLLVSLDLHGNSIGDDGCVALGEALAAGAAPALDLLDLSANRIEDRGYIALAPLFGEESCCPVLTHLNLRENGIESSGALFVSATTLPSLKFLDLSWNSIVSFKELWRALACDGTISMCPSLLELGLEGNSLSDMGCTRLCLALKASGATPLLIIDDSDTIDQEKEPDLSEGRLRPCLQLLADGDATNSQVCNLALWDSNHALDCLDEKLDGVPSENCDSEETVMPNELLRRDGFVVHPPISSTPNMAQLAATMDRLESVGWPPVFCFMNDAVWDLVTAKVWPVVRDLLGVDCVLDSASAFGWSLKATGKSTFPRDGEFRSWQNAVSSVSATVPKERDEKGHRGFGSSFGLPHRDYSAADSLHCEGEKGKESPVILTVWIPLNDATLDNGCMYVIPREFDTDFARTDNHHAHMNPATEVQRGLSSKIHFPLHGVRALPAPAGSLIAWHGNTIHWGSTCSRYAKVPRKSIALTFLRGDGDFGEMEAPPITITEACAMTPELRLAFISRSLLVYNQWHALADNAVPPLIYETTAVLEERERPA